MISYILTYDLINVKTSRNCRQINKMQELCYKIQYKYRLPRILFSNSLNSVLKIYSNNLYAYGVLFNSSCISICDLIT